MKRFVPCLLLWFVSAALLHAAPREQEWKQVEEQAQGENPESVVALLTKIEAAAKAEKAWPEAAKALALRIRVEAGQQSEELPLTRMDEVIPKAPAEMRPALTAIQATFFNNYFGTRRWQLMDRTAVAGGTGADIASWDLKRLLAETDARFQKALENTAALKGSTVTQWNGLLDPGALPDSYQPTLYDFVARQALQFYTAAGQEAVEVRAENAFEFAPDSPALGTMAEFLAWKPRQGDAPKLRAIRTYQSLLAFHKDDPDAGARVILDIDRLRWTAGAATGQGADDRRLTQLRALAAQNAAHESSLVAIASVADLLIKKKKPAEAHTLLTQAVAGHPKSSFASACRNLLKEIEEKELSATTELLWNSSGPEIHFTARNLEKLYFRLILVSKEPDPTLLDLIDDEERVAKVLRKKPARAWGLDLGKTGDFLEQTHHVPAPVDMKPGFYLLAVSGNVDFSKRRNQISFAPVIVSSLALINRVREEGENIAVDAWVLDAATGDPVPGAQISVWSEDEKTEKLAPQKTVPSDANGFATLAGDWDSDSVVFAVSHGNSAVSSNLSSSGRYQREDPDKNTSTYFFTDRALYRPGQTIQFKGIHVRHDTSKSDYRTLAGVKRTVILKDSNGRELAKQAVTTNAFGSFSGTFTAPQNGITGEMTVRDGNDLAQFRVEEYKRPKFKVEVLPPAVPPKLEDTVTMSVKATGYTGAPVDGAKVVWRVQREAEWSPWVRNSWWFHGHSSEKEIASGEATTGADGTAEIKFTAAPDKSVDPKTDPWFHYTVHADITDTAGETRSADDGVRVGYTAMKASVEAEEWQTVKKPVTFTVNTATLDDKPLKASGKLTVHRLVQPEKVHRPQLGSEYDDDDESYKDLSNPETWDTGEVVQREDVSTNEKGEAAVPVKLAAGVWRAIFESKDRAGKKVTAQTLVLVVDPAAEKFPVKIAFWAAARSLELKPGDDLSALWGSGYDRARAFIQIEHRGKVVQSFWSDAARTQQTVDFKVKEDHRGGFSVHIFQMRENRLVNHTLPVRVPWTNKELSLKWEHLTSKLEPGAKDTWTLSIAGPDKEKAAAELTAVLYDASLDAIAKHEWSPTFDCLRDDQSRFYPGFYNEIVDFEEAADEWGVEREAEDYSLRTWMFSSSNSAIVDKSPVAASGLRFGSDARSSNAIDTLIAGGTARVDYSVAPASASAPPPPPVMEAAYDSQSFSRSRSALGVVMTGKAKPEEVAGSSETRAITARKNMQETAFFLPQLLAADDGTVKMEFTMPEAVTTWRFMGFAHDKKLRSGYLEGETITARDLMVQPNPPRFLREGDTVEFTVKITNQSDTPQHGTARLSMADAATLTPADAALGLTAPEQPFEVPAKESRTVAWRLTIPDGQGFLTWKATAGTDKMSDGEEGWLPVLSRRILLTESLPLAMSKPGEREYTFEKLKESAASQTLRHQILTVQMVSQPSWYAVMALPYLMEFPHECSEQTFNRLYANALAQHIAGHDPKIRRTFDLWREAQPDALKSPLLKNQELKSVLIEETPWLRDAANETEQRRNVGLLFDANRLDSETARVLAQLDNLQSGDGSWPWFPGGPANEFITLYIVAGFGKLAHLGVIIKADSAVEALEWLDNWLAGEHKAALRADRARKDGKTGDHFDSSIALYLYARSFYLEQRPVPEELKPAVDYFLAQAGSKSPGKGRMAQAHAALGLLRFGDKPAAAKILASLKERSVIKEDLGRYWPEPNDAWRWDAAPIETQSLMIEAFREIAKDTETADECALWLLKQKQTQAWPTTKATADACYALLLGGTAKLSSDAAVSVSLAGSEVKPEKVEAGTGFFEKKIAAADIKPDMAAIKLTKSDKGAAWGSVHWQYLEDMSKVTPHEGTPLTITKSLFTKVHTPAGAELRPVQGKVKVGDELVVRLELRTDRDMEFVHLKDQRPSSVEPVNVLSEYKWQDSLGYYESTRDTASHFFFDALPKGTHVFEYSTRVQLRGACQTGVAELQCMYAPEFNSHSAGSVLEVE